MKSRLLGAISAIVLIFGLIPQATAVPVSLELALVVDISGSVDSNEYDLQIQGYRDAFYDPLVQSAITTLPQGLAVSLFFFSTTANDNLAGSTWSVPILDWELVTDAAGSEAFGDAIDALVDPRLSQSGSTNIASGIEAAMNSIMTNNFTAGRRVIDISGDGIQNVNLDGTEDPIDMGCNGDNQAGFQACIPVLTAQRDAAENAGITINGLPILTDSVLLENYFIDYVITSDGFTEPAVNFQAFGTAVRDKILTEVQVIPVPAAVWLFGSGLLALIGLARRKKTA